MGDSPKPAARSSARRSTASAHSTAHSQQASASSRLHSTGATFASASTPFPAQPTSSDEQFDTASALAVLMSLEAPSSAQLLEQQGKHWYTPQSCCFDLAGWPSGCSWKAERMCRRCTALYALCQVHRKVGKDGEGSIIAQALLSSAAHVTNCTRSAARIEKLPTLPLELIYLIFDQVFLDARINENAQAVQALMHTHSRTRARLVQTVEPLIIREHLMTHPCFQNQDAKGSWVEPFCTHIEWHIQSSMREPTSGHGEATGEAPPPVPNSSDWVNSASIWQPEAVEIRLEFGGHMVYGKTFSAGVSREGSQWIRVGDVQEAFQRALKDALPCLHSFAPYLRARGGWYSAAESQCLVEFSVALYAGASEFVLTQAWDICSPDCDPDDERLPP